MKKLLFRIQLLLILSFLIGSVNGQEVSIDDAGIETTSYDDIISVYDPFTDKLTIRSREFSSESQLNNGYTIRMMPVFIGERGCYKSLCGEFKIMFVADDISIVDLFNLYPDQISVDYPILIDGERNIVDVIAVDAQEYSDEDFTDDIFENDIGLGELFFLALIASLLIEDFDQALQEELAKNAHSSALVADLSYNQLMHLANSESARIRIERIMILFDDIIKSQIRKIDEILIEIRSEYTVKKDIEVYSGFESEGVGENLPIISTNGIVFEGDYNRVPMIQPLPRNVTNIEAEITVRFQVLPNGSVGSIVPNRGMNPDLERELMSTLRTWRFTSLPYNVPQENQWGEITFSFIRD